MTNLTLALGWLKYTNEVGILQVSPLLKGVSSVNPKPSKADTFDIKGVSSMELTKTQELIKKLKEVRESDEFTFPRIEEMIKNNGDTLSLSTIKRVFAEGSENINFSYEYTLLPIAKVLLVGEDIPSGETSDEASKLRAYIQAQNEEIERLHELKEHLESRISFLLDQIEKKDRRMDDKDKIIERLLNEYVLN